MKTKNTGVIVLVLIHLLPVFVWGASHPDAISPGQKDQAVPEDSVSISAVRKVAEGFRFTEGPVADNEGNIYFTDIPNSRIHQWSLDGKLSTFLENTGRANGLYFDMAGNLAACAGGTGKVVSIDPQGNITVLADRYQGKPFNSPNDLWIDSEGGIYFTDPQYGSRETLPQDGEHVYYLSPDRKRIIRVIDDMVRPNGVIGTPDGKLLYVADHGDNKTYRYNINPDGTLTDKRLFTEQGSDGMTLDRNGNLYLTAQAVTVYTPSGKLIKTIPVPEMPSNLCFGGKQNKNTLFITARTSLYSVEIEPMGSKLYSFTMDDIDGTPVSLSHYSGKVLLIVNVASKCGFTKQYTDLQKLYETYKERGVHVLGFPANNFLGQEPGTDAEIKSFCTTQFNVTFPLFSKISVKGKDIHPLYQYLTSPEENGEHGKPITWNFNKFLIGRDGITAGYFGSKVEPLDPQITGAVEEALGGL
jgi:gluconolactonase